jgi:hypothetical protein
MLAEWYQYGAEHVLEGGRSPRPARALKSQGYGDQFLQTYKWLIVTGAL